MSEAPRQRLQGLYAITPAALLDDDERLQDAVAAAIRGGARLIQYRDKQHSAARRLQQARQLAALCRAQNVALIINDDIELAAACGAHGVHLGAQDGAPQTARRVLGAQAIIGVTCGNSLQRAQTAVAAGADYVAFGRFFASQTKPDAPPAEIATLQAAHSQLAVPICAIGGITPDNAGTLLDAGASLIAAIHGVFAAPDIEAAARAYADGFLKSTPRIP